MSGPALSRWAVDGLIHSVAICQLQGQLAVDAVQPLWVADGDRGNHGLIGERG